MSPLIQALAHNNNVSIIYGATLIISGLWLSVGYAIITFGLAHGIYHSGNIFEVLISYGDGNAFWKEIKKPSRKNKTYRGYIHQFRVLSVLLLLYSIFWIYVGIRLFL